MKYKNYTAYDDDDFFEKYHQKRSLGNAPNERIEQPIIDELIGNIEGMNILDLGCGNGKYGVELLKREAKHYHGVEGSINMMKLAAVNLEGYSFTLQHKDIEKTEFLQSEYDLVVSRLVLHYIEDVDTLLQKIYESLKPEGIFIFSIEHPIITSCYDTYHQKVRKGNWIVDNYFDSGERINEWLGKKVVKYHRTLEEYWQLIQQAGFQVLELRESKPERANFEKQEEYERRKRIPLFLMFKLQK